MPQYYDPEELKSLQKELAKEIGKEDGSPIVSTGRARDITLRYAKKSDELLDVGTGAGKFLTQMAEIGFQNLHALDFDSYVSKCVKLRSFHSADMSWDKMPWPDNTFDVITGWEVIEHLENPPRFLREMRRILKPAGLLILSTPNIDHLYNRLVFLKRGDMPRWRETANHLFSFPKGVYRKLILKYFDEIGREYIKGEFPYKIFRHIKFPETKLFGNTVVWILKNKQK